MKKAHIVEVFLIILVAVALLVVFLTYYLGK
jgi:hypothetical protein